jgi:hypothetical protein
MEAMPIRVAVAAAIAVVGLSPALAAEPSGETVAVDRTASASGVAGLRVLAAGSAVFSGDRITTDETGLAQIRFADDTRMVVGPNSDMTIDSFVFAGPDTASAFTLNAVRGAFRFITGASPRQAYTINTSIATIGVRGTVFDGTFDEDGTANFVLYDNGQLRICYKQSRPRRCAVFEGQCNVVVLSPEGEFAWRHEVIDRTAFIDEVFPLAFKDAAFEPGFSANSGTCNVRDVTGPPREGENPPFPVPEPEPEEEEQPEG